MSVTSEEVAAALVTSSALGEFFAIDPEPRSGEWLRLAALSEPAVIEARVVATESAIATMAGLGQADIAPRVAASTVSLGIFARVLAAAFGAFIVTGILPELSLESLWWQPVLGGAVPLSLDPVPGFRPAGDAGEAFGSVVLRGVIAPLVSAFEEAGVSPVVLLGNVASALGGAARMIATARPDLATAAWSFVEELLRQPMLRGTATVGAGELRRNSCCLFYKVPGGGYCGDCVLRDRGAFNR